jgi:hypothetical protein
MTQILFIGVPVDVKADVNALLKRYRCALPGWLKKLTVEYTIRPEAGLEESIAAIHVMYEYRHARLRIHGCEWSRPDVDRERVIVHELFHCHVAPLEKIAHSLLERRAEANEAQGVDPLLEAMYEQVRIAMESVVEDCCTATIAARYAGEA